MINNKKGLSEVVGYVLLIGVAVSLSVLVYYFIQSYLPKPISECPEGVSIVIQDYSCSTDKNEFNLTVQNKGLFDIDGFILKASDDAGIPTKTLKYRDSNGSSQSSGLVLIDNNIDLVLKPSDKFNANFNYSSQEVITKIQVIPFKLYKGETLLCGKSAITQDIEKCD